MRVRLGDAIRSLDLRVRKTEEEVVGTSDGASQNYNPVNTSLHFPKDE